MKGFVCIAREPRVVVLDRPQAGKSMHNISLSIDGHPLDFFAEVQQLLQMGIDNESDQAT